MHLTGRKSWTVMSLLLAAVLAGCSSTSLTRAPVEDRGAGGASAAAIDPATLPGAENAGKPGYYTVKAGDTVMQIARDHNQNWRDIARWSNLADSNQIEVGQVLRVAPPPVASAPAPAPARPPATATQTTPGVVAAATPPAAPAVAPAPAPAPAAPPPPPSAGADDISFIWPANGALVASFDEAKNKGVGIAGKAGDPVLAAADGRVVYAGAGLRGYGNLIILKHNNTFLTAYAHNQALLVKEDQNVKKGQKIAEMGSTDADRVKLHFEIRRSGKPVDPARYLPAR